MDLVSLADAALEPQAVRRYAIELLYENPPTLDLEQVRTLERGATGDAAAIEVEVEAERATITWRAINGDGATDLGSCVVEGSSQPADSTVTLAAASQSWWWQEARQVAPRCRFAVRIFDRDAEAIDRRVRVGHLQEAVATIHQHCPAAAIHWVPAQQLMAPNEATAGWRSDGFTNPMPGAINVRAFRVGGEPEAGEAEWLMDTMGLAAVGLRDLQCHFRGLDPNEVSRSLYNTALYLWEKGDVLEDGHTVEGPRPDDEWRCQRENARAQPRRAVVDLDPGFPFTAGAH